MPSQRLDFPKGFLWGASTSSHQTEGNTNNQWTEWERSLVRRAQLERNGLIAKHGHENFISGEAVDHYNRYDADFALARSLGHSATRISIEWSRIEPREGYFDPEAIRHYRDVIASIRAHGMEPFVTLWHWTVPGWFMAKGEFARWGNVLYFARFAERMATELPDVKFWITLNEAEFYISNSYAHGQWPPQKKNWLLALWVYHNLIHAHRAAFAKIKSVRPDALVGVAKPVIYFEAYRNRPWNRFVKNIYNWGLNLYFLDWIVGAMDFIGVNYYFHARISGLRTRNENLRTSDLGWELYPEGMYHVLIDISKRYRCPIYITENGLADAKDTQRAWFIKETLKHVHRAIAEGADVRGYLHWSLMDNFEWAQGFWPRFGLIEIDYATQERRPRASAFVYQKICESNGLEE